MGLKQGRISMGSVIRIVSDDDSDDDAIRIVPDGGTVKTRMLVMDAHRPGYVELSDEQIAKRQDARQEMIDRATSAWRMDAKRKKPPPDDDDGLSTVDKQSRATADARADARASYDSMCARLRDSWKTSSESRNLFSRDAAEPDLSTPPSELMRRHTSDPNDPADVQARRDKAYRGYTTALSEAWRSGPGAAPAEHAIVGAGPKSVVEEPDRGGRTDPTAASRIKRTHERTIGEVK
jgi:hypothetical protein